MPWVVSVRVHVILLLLLRKEIIVRSRSLHGARLETRERRAAGMLCRVRQPGRTLRVTVLGQQRLLVRTLLRVEQPLGWHLSL